MNLWNKISFDVNAVNKPIFVTALYYFLIYSINFSLTVQNSANNTC